VRFEQTLDHEHVGLPPATAVHAMLHRAAARIGRSPSYRVIVSTFDAAFRVVAADLAIGVVQLQVGSAYAGALGVKLIALADTWARRRFAVCFRDFESLPPPARRLLDHLVASAAASDPADPARASTQPAGRA
jgi:DNA-binding transcriptional LysR family regulator